MIERRKKDERLTGTCSKLRQSLRTHALLSAAAGDQGRQEACAAPFLLRTVQHGMYRKTFAGL